MVSGGVGKEGWRGVGERLGWGWGRVGVGVGGGVGEGLGRVYLSFLQKLRLKKTVNAPVTHVSPVFARQKKKGTVQNCPQNAALAGCHFSTRKSSSEAPE